MAALNESTAVARDSKIPTRRISWTDETETLGFRPQNEKYAPLYTATATSNPFGDIHSLPPAANRAPTSGDVEAQDSPYSFKLNRKHKALACTIATCLVVTWILLLVAVLLFTDSLYPTAMRSYQALKDIKDHVVDTHAAMEIVKAQVGKMYGLISGYEDMGRVEGDFGGY